MRFGDIFLEIIFKVLELRGVCTREFRVGEGVLGKEY